MRCCVPTTASIISAAGRRPGLVAAINALGEPGLALEREPDRLYPQTSLAAHVVGFTDVDGKGNAGIERAFDEQLRDPARRGQPIVLSISSRIQQALEHELNEAMTHFSAIGAAGVIMDIHTGEILAMTSLPQLNPNAAGQGTPEARFNRATLGVYELGSTFKPFTVAMAMDSGIIKSMGQMYNCPQRAARRRPDDQRHASVRPRLLGRRDHEGKLQHRHGPDCRPARADAAKGIPSRRWASSTRCEIELKERGRTLTPGANWNQIETMTVGYGHGIAVTPLHLAIGYATLFNGGIYRPATLLKVDRNHAAGKGHRVFSEETSYKMRALAAPGRHRRAPARKADAPGYRVGGKTGTAQKIIGGRYSNSVNVTSFAGVFPMDEPRYVIVVMLDEPKATPETFGFTTAGWNVAPVVSKTVSRIAPMLGVRPDKNREPNMAEVLPFVHEKAEH